MQLVASSVPSSPAGAEARGVVAKAGAPQRARRSLLAGNICASAHRVVTAAAATRPRARPDVLFVVSLACLTVTPHRHAMVPFIMASHG